MENKEQKIKGVLKGLAWGDVLGCPIEMWKEKEIKHVYGRYTKLPEKYNIEKIRQIGQNVSRLRPIGLYSDDAQQALALLQICLQPNGWNLMKWKDLLVFGMKEHVWRGYGANFKKAVFNMQKGVNPSRTGSESAGIGAAMRIGVIGALYYDDKDMLKKVTLESTLSTHGDIRAGAYSYAITWTIAQLLNGASIKEIKENLDSDVRKIEEEIEIKYKNWKVSTKGKNEVSNALRFLKEKDSDDIHSLRKEISEYAKPFLQKGFTKAHPNQGFVLTGGMNALFSALQENIEPNEVLIDIVNLGYDTDTVAAISGSILGARFGEEWVPLKKIQASDRIENYAKSMIKKTVPESQKDYLKMEKKLTREERIFEV